MGAPQTIMLPGEVVSSSVVRLAAPVAGQSEGLELLTEKFSQAQRFTIDDKLSIEVSMEEIASAISADGEVEMVFKLMERTAANGDHPIKKIPADPPFRSRYQYVP